ncbi:MAG: SRPBCC domain-containing protein [Actinomycetota bacterium]
MAKVEQGVVRVQRRFEAPRERVFDAWTDPKVLREWWAAMPTMTPGEIDVDLREGGRYRMQMRAETGEVHTVVGEYTEVRRPDRIAYTWEWETNDKAMAGSASSLVEVEFAADGDGTSVTLTHSGFGSPEVAGMHEHGWNGTFDSLALYLSA